MTRTAGLLLVASLAAGCTSSTPTSPALTAGDLSGTWNLSVIRAAGQPEQPKPAGAAYTLTFADTRVSVRADCNVCGGAFALSDRTITIGPAVACTRAFCPTNVFANAFETLLAGEHTVLVADNTLLLSSPRGALRFAR
jgi:heat shock protein HslJ